MLQHLTPSSKAFDLGSSCIDIAEQVSALEAINHNMTEVSRATKSFGRQNSQTTAKLMSLNMLTAGSPYRVLRQCLAEIDARKNSVQDAVLALKEANYKIDELNACEDGLSKIQLERETIKIHNIQKAVSGALKDIAVFQDAYAQVKETYGIRDGWDELDFERAEIEHHTRSAFLHAYRDVMTGGLLGMGTLEYLEQFGIHPHVALVEAREYVSAVDQLMQSGVVPDATHLYSWLDSMVEKYKNGYQVAMKRLGLTELRTEWAMYRTDRN